MTNFRLSRLLYASSLSEHDEFYSGYCTSTRHQNISELFKHDLLEKSLVYLEMKCLNVGQASFVFVSDSDQESS